MQLAEYLHNLKFNENPFQHTNADKEIDLIEQYFIPPDYFEDVWGDPQNPVSNIVYAPRGGGKTAQRLMIEKKAAKSNNVLTITYADHDLTRFKSIADITLNYHLEYLNRLLLLSFFDRLYSSPNYDFQFQFNWSERQFIYKLCRIYLVDTPASFPSQAIKALKTPTDHFVQFLRSVKEPIAELIKKISKAKGAEVDISSIELDSKLQGSHKDNFVNIRNFLYKLGFTTLYILVDKVDEQSLTGNDPKASYTFISTLIKDLELLDTPGVGFKFFLWDALKPYCAKDARPDRVFSYNLNWTSSQIRSMLNKRCAAYSSDTRDNALDLFVSDRGLGRVILFSEFSPRDCIRICSRILSEQFKENPYSLKFEMNVVNNSIDLFCKEKVSEFLKSDGNIRHLSKVGLVSFTIEKLVANKVASDSAAARNIIQPWNTADLIKKIGLVNRRGKKAVNEYAFVDVRMARYACMSVSLDDFVKSKVRRCKKEGCKTFAYREYSKAIYQCVHCSSVLEEE